MTSASRRLAAITLALFASVMLLACAPSPAPTPTPTAAGFASEEEAFATAEQTLSDYIDASNLVRLDDTRSFEAFFALSVGAQNDADRQRLSLYHAERYTSSGATIVQGISADSWTPPEGPVSLLVCLDVSDVDILSADGESIVASDRPNLQSVQFTFDGTGGALLVASIVGTDEAACDL